MALIDRIRQNVPEQVLTAVVGLLESSPDAIICCSADGEIYYVNGRALALFGYDREELLGQPVELLVPEAVRETHVALREAYAARPRTGPMRPGHPEATGRRKDGSEFPISVGLSYIRMGNDLLITSVIRDISQMKEAQEALRKSEAFNRAVLSSLVAPIAVLDRNGVILTVNEAWRRYAAASKSVLWRARVGENYVETLSRVRGRAAREARTLLNGIRSVLDGTAPIFSVERHATFREESRWFLTRVMPLKTEEGGVVISHTDITDRKEQEERLAYVATHDPLTNLPNRHVLEDALGRAVARAARGLPGALLFLDLDNFKLVNDTLGHAAGDQVLGSFTRLLQRSLRPDDLLARFGGDEFAVLLEGTTLEEAYAVAQRLRRAVEEARFELLEDTGEHRFDLGVSIGLVAIDGRDDPTVILSRADAAMYAAKEQGRNRVVAYRPEVDISNRLSEANSWAARIKDALRQDRFEIHYQPVVRLADDSVEHYEALIRMRDEDGDLVSPGLFIPAAERFGLMPQLDRWVVDHVLETLTAYPDLKIFVNISGQSLADEALLEYIEARVQELDLRPGRLGFEITETAIIQDLMSAERWLHRLRALGCRFALDDFGAGFNSLSYLRNLPIDQLKIDGSFIRTLASDPKQRALVLAMHRLAEILNMESVAEFVESEAILEVLQDLGVTCGQGYHLGKPAAALPQTGHLAA